MATTPCILHVGMPKTGSSSIQEYLSHGLRDPRFLYIGLGEVNGSRPLITLGMDNPENHWVHRRNRATPRQAKTLRHRYQRALEQSLTQARYRGLTPILSGEGCWRLSAAALTRVRDHISAQGFQAHVIVYLRPYLSWLESNFQQALKTGQGAFEPRSIHFNRWEESPNEMHAKFAYSKRLDVLASVFGSDRVSVRLFKPDVLSSGCVVHDFCAATGIEPPLKALPRENDRLSLDAVRLLYVHKNYHPRGQPLSLNSYQAIVSRLVSLRGEGLRFHPCILESISDQLTAEENVIYQRYGLDISDHRDVTVLANCIRNESDLFRFSSTSLDWLATTTGSTLTNANLPDARRQIALAVDRLRLRPWRPWQQIVGRR
ncbi:MAG: hypothetical protein VKN13_07175 [Cyanobacteriota bacterium]|nr:hypothetical protein [Cyanobacteriota bacterium]